MPAYQYIYIYSSIYGNEIAFTTFKKAYKHCIRQLGQSRDEYIIDIDMDKNRQIGMYAVRRGNFDDFHRVERINLA
jgi:hypothetical protein